MGGKRQTARVTHFYARTVLLNDRFDEDIIIMYIFFLGWVKYIVGIKHIIIIIQYK